MHTYINWESIPGKPTIAISCITTPNLTPNATPVTGRVSVIAAGVDEILRAFQVDG